MSPATKRSAIRNGVIVLGATAFITGATIATHLSHSSAQPTHYMIEQTATGSPAASTPAPSASATSPRAVSKPLAVVPRSSVVVKQPAVQENIVTDSTAPAATPTDTGSAAAPIDTAGNTLPTVALSTDQAGVTRAPAPPLPTISTHGN